MIRNDGGGRMAAPVLLGNAAHENTDRAWGAPV